MNATTVTNGRPRKQLADQLDRLDEQMDRADGIIDALADGLNQAVADAARDGVTAAVKDAVIELMTNPDLRAAVHRATAPPAEARPSVWERLKGRARRAAAQVAAAARAVGAAVADKAASLRVAAGGLAGPARAAWRLKTAALIGLGVGAAVAGVAYAASHGVAAGLSGLGAAVTTVAIQAVLWVRQAVRRLAMT
jgi:hypothetical protein